MIQTDVNNAQSMLTKPEKIVEYHGYYVKNQNMYYPIDMHDVKFDFDKLRDLKCVPVVDDDFTIIVFKKNWSERPSRFFSQTILADNFRPVTVLTPRVLELAKDRFEIKFENLKKHQLLIIHDDDGVFCVGLGDISEYLLHLFSDVRAKPAYCVVENLRLALKSFPENEQLKQLFPLWEEKKDLERAEAEWEDVLIKWDKYKSTDDDPTKEVYASHVVSQLEYYKSLPHRLDYSEKIQDMFAEIQHHQDECIARRLERKIEIPEEREIKGSVTRYRSRDRHNITVTFVNVGDNGDVLMRFSGIPNDANELVYRHTHSIQNSSTEAFIYKTYEINGINRNSFCMGTDGWGDNATFIYAPYIDERITVHEVNDSKEDPIETSSQLYRDYVKRISC